MRRFVLLALLCLAGCAASAHREPFPAARPPSSAELHDNYQQAVELTANAVAAQGYSVGEVEYFERVKPNYWKIRFGLAPKGSGKILEVYFDGTRGEVVNAKELGPVSSQ